MWRLTTVRERLSEKKKVVIVTQGQLGNCLFAWAYGLAISSSSNLRVEIVSECNSFLDLTSQLEEHSNLIDLNLKVKKIGNLTSLLIKIVEWLKYRDKSVIQECVSKLFGINLVFNPWEAPTARELKRINIGYFQNVEIVEKNKEALSNVLWYLLNQYEALVNPKLPMNYLKDGFVALHLRRGDYRNIPEYGILSMDFGLDLLYSYNKSILVTSDESSIKNEVSKKIPNSIFLDRCHFSDLETLFILANSDALVISNSTFAWWAGFLASSRGKTVVAPRPWFKVPVVPENYLRYSNFLLKDAVFEPDS